MRILFMILLIVHVCCGVVSLFSATGALSTAKGKTWHRWFGRFFFYGMTGIFITAIPMSILHPSLFLFLISLFSYYFAFTGWRYARNISELPTRMDWAVAFVMMTIAFFMVCMGVFFYSLNAARAITLLVFGCIGLRLSYEDLQICRRGGVHGRQRLIKHLTSMIAATIAAVTAFAVTNFSLEPKMILWLGPTALLVPVIVWWRKRVQEGKMKLK